MSNEEQIIAELENDPVSKLLGGLKRVEAPGDFDFRVKARIASGRPVDRSASWLPNTVRLAVPLGLLLLIGGYFGFSVPYPANNADRPAIAGTQPANFAPAIAVSSDLPAALPANNVPPVRASEKAPETVAKTDPPTKEKRVITPEPAVRRPGGGTVDMALTEGRTIVPKGVGTARVSIKQILSSIGIDANYSSSWKVGSVRQNSRAERSGLKSGDVIEAIDGQNLTEKTTFENKSSGKSIRILRDGKSMQINLKP